MSITKANNVSDKANVVAEVENQNPQPQQQQSEQQSPFRYADELEIAKNIVRASALMRLKEGFDQELYEVLVNMRAAQLVRDKAKLALKHERQELRSLMDEYKNAQSKEERDRIYERIKQKNTVIDQHMKLIRQADDEFAKQLRFANNHFEREEDMIDSYVRSLNSPEPFKFLLRLLYGTGHLMKVAAFHLSAIKIKNSAVERAYLNDIAEAYKTKNIQRMEQLATKALSDDAKVREATQNDESLFENDVRDELMKALQAMREAHEKLEKALLTKFSTLAEAEKLIQSQKKELSQGQAQEQDQEPPAPAV